MPSFAYPILIVSLMVGASAGSPEQGRMGGSVVGLPAARTIPVKAEDARLMSVQEFQQQSAIERQRMLAAWIEKGPLRAGETLLPILKVALVDPEMEVRRHGLTLFRRFDGALNAAALGGTPDPISRSAFGEVQRIVVDLIDHPDVSFRRAVLHALRPTAYWHPEVVEEALVGQFVRERDVAARSAIVEALGECARKGSSRSRQVVLKALEEETSGVQLGAVNAVARIQAPEALPSLLRALNATDPVLRAAAAGAIGAQGAAARKYLTALRARFENELDPTVRKQLSRVIGALAGA